MSESSLSENPYWDEKAENFGVHNVVGKTEVCVGHLILEDAFNPVLMENCPTRSELVVLVIRPENQELIDLYWANEKLCTVIALDLGISHGMVFLCMTKIDDYPDGLLSEFVSKADKGNWLVN